MKTIKEYLNEGLIKRQAGAVDLRTKIEVWLKEHDIENYIINDDLTIDINGSVDLRSRKEERLPEYIQFGKVTGNFYIFYCPELESLEGCPKEVDWDFYCYKCSKLESLEGAPEKVGGDFWCNDCANLKSLEGCPKKVGKGFWCYGCGKQFTESDVKKVCKVKGMIIA